MHTLKATCTRCGKQDAFITTKEGYRCICGNYIPYRIDQKLNRNQALAAMMDGMVISNGAGAKIGYIDHGNRFQARFVYLEGDRLEEIMNYDWETDGNFKVVGRWLDFDGTEYVAHFNKLKRVCGLEFFRMKRYIRGFNYDIGRDYPLELN